MPALIHIARFRDFVAKAYDQISRVAGKSPEGTGAVAALAVVAVFSLAMAAVGGHLRSPADEVIDADMDVESLHTFAPVQSVLTMNAELAGHMSANSRVSRMPGGAFSRGTDR